MNWVSVLVDSGCSRIPIGDMLSISREASSGIGQRCSGGFSGGLGDESGVRPKS